MEIEFDFDTPVEEKIVNDYDKGFVCKCCGSYCKTYTRSFNSNMAICLIILTKHKINGFVKVEDFLLQHGQKRCGDFSYLRFYGFLEKQEGKRDDNSKRNGYYKITGRGIAFAENRLTAPAKFKITNNKFEGFVGKEITIKDALGTKFDFQKLMSKEVLNEEAKESLKHEG